MLLSCKACDAPLKADTIDMRHGLATCHYCDAVMRFDELKSDEPAANTTSKERAVVPMPSGIQVEDFGSRLRIVRRWFAPVAFFLLFFCIAWDSFLIFWYSIAFGDGNAPWIMKVFPVAHVAVGIGLTYYTLALFVNKTEVEVEAGQLSIRHGPLPWRGGGSHDTTQIEQIYCKEKIKQSENGPRSNYELHAVFGDGQSKKLCDGFTEADHALFLEQQLERHLGIEDRPVGGEMAR